MNDTWLDEEAPEPMPLMTRRGCLWLTFLILLLIFTLLFLRAAYLTALSDS